MIVKPSPFPSNDSDKFVATNQLHPAAKKGFLIGNLLNETILLFKTIIKVRIGWGWLLSEENQRFYITYWVLILQIRDNGQLKFIYSFNGMPI